MSNSDDVWSHLDRLISIWNILIFMSGLGTAGAGMITILNHLPAYYPIGFFILSTILVTAGVYRSYLSYNRWRLIHNEEYPEATEIIKTLWGMHITLGELITPAHQNYIKAKKIKGVSYKLGELLGVSRKKYAKLKPNKITFYKLMLRLLMTYRINPKDILSLTSISNDMGRLMDKSGWGLSGYLGEKPYSQMQKEFNIKKLELKISPETSVLIDNVNHLSFGLYSLAIAGEMMLKNRLFNKWLGIKGVNSFENTINNKDTLYQAALLEVKRYIIYDIANT